MNRRDTLATLIGRKVEHKKTNVEAIDLAAKSTSATLPINTGLEPYTGDWEFQQAAHLLRRAMFGPNYAQIKSAVQNGMDATVTQLLQDQALPDPPVNPSYAFDSNVPIGETWIDAPYNLLLDFGAYRGDSLVGWSINLLLEEGVSIREKMTLFWHNHFVAAEIEDPKFAYRYMTLLRENALGNFKTLVEEVTIDPQMLRYLNGNQNRKDAPNENYARELFELFTIGKGPLIEPGNYTHYTEDDIIAASKVLTGWVDMNHVTLLNNVSIGSQFINDWHDETEKTFSDSFNNASILPNGEEEYKDLIDLIFDQDEVARFICRKLYRWFVYYTIDDTIEQNMIEPMAQILRDNDYNVKPVLEALLKSQHFYDMLSLGALIKSPIDFLTSIFKPFNVELSNSLANKYFFGRELWGFAGVMQQQIFNPPSVAGWKAFYQEPAFYRHWINSVTLRLRLLLTDVMSFNGIELNDGEFMEIDVLEFITTFDNPWEAYPLINEMVSILLPRPITTAQIEFLREVLLPGLPIEEWNIQYSDYASDPGNEALAVAIAFRLKVLIRTIMAMPEFHLS